MDPIERIEAAVRAALERPGMGVPTGPLLVACSGGPDSLTLLDVLAALGVPLAVACVDHGLRPAAADEARAVERFAASLGVPATVLRVQVGKATMAGARRARYDALCAHALATGARAIAVAHTATDQTETLLDRLVRGAGVRGLSAMARVRDVAPGVRLIRPLLEVTRDEVEAYVVARGLPVSRDPTNENMAYRRSRIRHQVLPLLRRERPDLDRSIASLCDRLRADADHLDAEAERALAAITRSDGDTTARRDAAVPSVAATATPRDAGAPATATELAVGVAPGALPRRGPALDVRALVALPDAIAARVVARASGTPLDALHIDAVRALCRSLDGTRSIDLPGGVAAERCYDRLRFGVPLADPGDVEVAVDAPGRYRLLRVEVAIDEGAWRELGGGPLVLRNFRHGDRGRGGKLKDDFIDRRIPRPERRWLPLLVRRHRFEGTVKETVVWAPWQLVGTGPVCNNVVDSVEAFAGSTHPTK